MPIGFPNGDQYKDEVEAQLDGRYQMPIINPDVWVQNKTGAPIGSEWDDMEHNPIPQEQKAVEPKTGFINVADAGERDSSAVQKRTVFDVLTGFDGKERYQLWPEKVVRDTANSIEKLGSGNIDLNSPEGVKAAFDVASLMVMGPAPLALTKKAVDGTLGSFAGVKAALPKEKLLKAQEIIQKPGFDPVKDAEMLWKETGFFKGTDGQLRYEISDAGAKLKISESSPQFQINNLLSGQPLERVLDHPELFKAYPDLKGMKVKLDPSLQEGTAFFSQGSNSITLGPGNLKDAKVIMHEVQHWIQGKEGFAKGGAPAKDFKLRLSQEVDDLEHELAFNPNLPPDRVAYIERVIAKNKEYMKAGTDEAHANYTRLAGETEARNVETRMSQGKYFNEDMYLDQMLIAKKAGYDLAFVKKPSWGDLGYSEPMGLKDKTGKFVDINTVPKEVQQALKIINGVKADTLPPWLTEDVARSQQHVSHTSQWGTPYGYGDPMTPPPW